MKYTNASKLDRKSGGTLVRTWGTCPFLERGGGVQVRRI
jgi:hypothetical protein